MHNTCVQCISIIIARKALACMALARTKLERGTLARIALACTRLPRLRVEFGASRRLGPRLGPGV
jgi:hypothetical protein